MDGQLLAPHHTHRFLTPRVGGQLAALASSAAAVLAVVAAAEAGAARRPQLLAEPADGALLEAEAAA